MTICVFMPRQALPRRAASKCTVQYCMWIAVHLWWRSHQCSTYANGNSSIADWPVLLLPCAKSWVTKTDLRPVQRRARRAAARPRIYERMVEQVKILHVTWGDNLVDPESRFVLDTSVHIFTHFEGRNSVSGYRQSRVFSWLQLVQFSFTLHEPFVDSKFGTILHAKQTSDHFKLS